MRSDSVQRASGNEGNVYVSLISAPPGGASEPGSKSLRKAILTAGIQSQNRRQRSGDFGPTQNRPRLFEPGERKQTGGAEGDGGESGSSDLLRQIKIKIERAKFYPLIAKRTHLEGAPEVELKIKQNGSLEYVALKKSCGSKILDDAALSTVKLAAPFPFYPEPIALNIQYNLK